jgi:hypothetical protein
MTAIFTCCADRSFDDRIDEHEDAYMVSQRLSSKVMYEEITKNHQAIANSVKEQVQQSLGIQSLNPYKVVIAGIKLVDGKKKKKLIFFPRHSSLSVQTEN